MSKRKPANLVIPHLTLELASRINTNTYLFTEKVEGYTSREQYIDSVLYWARSFTRQVEALQKGNN